jgi:hypothetical protein
MAFSVDAYKSNFMREGIIPVDGPASLYFPYQIADNLNAIYNQPNFWWSMNLPGALFTESSEVFTWQGTHSVWLNEGEYTFFYNLHLEYGGRYWNFYSAIDGTMLIYARHNWYAEEKQNYTLVTSGWKCLTSGWHTIGICCRETTSATCGYWNLGMYYQGGVSRWVSSDSSSTVEELPIDT